MYSKYPKDSGSGKNCANEAVNTDFDDKNLEIANLTPSDSPIQVTRAKQVEESDAERQHSVMQMAFLQLMTRKVIEATANSSAVLKDVNSRIRSDRD